MARTEMTPERVIEIGRIWQAKFTKKEARLISALLRGSEPKIDNELVSKVFNNPDNPLNKKVRTYVAKRDNIQPPFEVTGFTKKDVREALTGDTMAKQLKSLSPSGRVFLRNMGFYNPDYFVKPAKTKRMKAKM